MDISIKDISSVDKQLIITAKRSDLQERFDKAYKKYQKNVKISGFRTGMVPLSIIKTRYGKELEYEESIKYIQDVYQKDVMEKYKPVGIPKFEDYEWKNNILHATYQIGIEPTFELMDLKKLTIDYIEHDVTEEEINELIEKQLKQLGEKISVNEPINKEHSVIVDWKEQDDNGKTEEHKGIVLNINDIDEKIQQPLLHKKIGDTVDIDISNPKGNQKIELTICAIQKQKPIKLSKEHIQKYSKNKASTKEEYHTYMRSYLQNETDAMCEEEFRKKLSKELVEKHQMDIPKSMERYIKQSYIEQYINRHKPETPTKEAIENYVESIKNRIEMDAKWFFIFNKLQQLLPNSELEPADVDAYLKEQADLYNVSLDEIKSNYAKKPQLINTLHERIIEQKVFSYLKEHVQLNKISKNEYIKKERKND